MRRRPREKIIWSSCVATVGGRCDGRRSSSVYQDVIGRLRFTQFRRQLFHNPRWALAVGGGERAGAGGLRDGSGRTGRRADPVTPAHSHTRLWGEIASPQRATHLRTAPPVLFRSRKWIRFVEGGSGAARGRRVGVPSPGPSSLQYPTRVLQRELGLSDSPHGASGAQEQEMKCVPFFFFLLLIDFPFYH